MQHRYEDVARGVTKHPVDILSPPAWRYARSHSGGGWQALFFLPHAYDPMASDLCCCVTLLPRPDRTGKLIAKVKRNKGATPERERLDIHETAQRRGYTPERRNERSRPFCIPWCGERTVDERGEWEKRKIDRNLKAWKSVSSPPTTAVVDPRPNVGIFDQNSQTGFGSSFPLPMLLLKIMSLHSFHFRESIFNSYANSNIFHFFFFVIWIKIERLFYSYLEYLPSIFK